MCFLCNFLPFRLLCGKGTIGSIDYGQNYHIWGQNSTVLDTFNKLLGTQSRKIGTVARKFSIKKKGLSLLNRDGWQLCSLQNYTACRLTILVLCFIISYFYTLNVNISLGPNPCIQ